MISLHLGRTFILMLEQNVTTTFSKSCVSIFLSTPCAGNWFADHTIIRRFLSLLNSPVRYHWIEMIKK